MGMLKNLVADLEQRLGEQTGQQVSGHEASPSNVFQNSGAETEVIAPFEHDTALAETVPMTFSIDLENSELSSAAFGSATLEGTSFECANLGSLSLESSSMSSTALERTPFGSSSLVNPDANSVGGLDQSPSSGMSDQNSSGDWLDGIAILSPPTTASDTQQFFTPTTMQPFGGFALSDLMQADLMQADLVHPIAPNIHRRNYLIWASQKCPSPAQIALQYAMRAVAAAVSAQYRPLSGMLCAESRRVLEQMDADGTGDCGDIPIAQIQAWLLVAHYELLCKHEHQAMLTAGRAIRMVQLARLHDVDAQQVSTMSLGAEKPLFPGQSLYGDDSPAESEEKRRTFWLAYCFDRFCLMRSECPPSLQEESVSNSSFPAYLGDAVQIITTKTGTKLNLLQIRTRLPAPEANFQNSEPVRMDFLFEALANSGRTVLPPFAKCVVLNSLLSRCMSHQRLAREGSISGGSDSRKFWSQHAWLALAVEKIKQLLFQSLPNATDNAEDPMLTFVHALAACAAIYVYQSMAQFMAWPTVDHEVGTPAYEEQAIQIAGELVQFIKMTPRSVSHFKAHPFLPNLIHRAAVFLIGLSRSPNALEIGYNDREEDLNTLFGALRNLQQVNNLSRGILCKLEKDAFCIK
ncbi:MAG: hypothetical protein Q9165_008741 [Trypethelium subeluteriae]